MRQNVKRSGAARLAIPLLVVLFASILAACGWRTTQPARQVPGGDPRLGRELVASYGCASCHIIPGIRGFGGAESHVAPPLNGFANRRFIGGEAANTPENLIVWVQNPQVIRPGSAMPNVGVNESDARHISAYLYTLR